MADVSQWYDTAAGNNTLTPPDGAPENATLISDFNNIVRENQAAIRRQCNQLGWFEYGDGSGPYAAIYLSATSFRIQGEDVTAAYTPNTRIRIFQNSMSTELIGIVTASAFDGNDTDVTVLLEAGSIANATIDAIYLGQGASPNPAPVATTIRDTDRDTFVTTEGSPDDDRIRMAADGQDVFLGSRLGTQQPLQPGFSYYISAAQSGISNVTGAGSPFVVSFQSKNFERGTMMQAGQTTMVAVLAGIYDVDLALALSGLDETTERVIVEIQRSDGVAWRWDWHDDQGMFPDHQNDFPIQMSRKIELQAGQSLQVELTVEGMAGNTVDLIGSDDKNRCEWSAMLIG